jgi:hypothetical protein
MSESRKMTTSRALDALGDYYADRAGGGDVEAGWKLLQRAMDEDDEPAESPVSERPGTRAMGG